MFKISTISVLLFIAAGLSIIMAVKGIITGAYIPAFCNVALLVVIAAIIHVIRYDLCNHKPEVKIEKEDANADNSSMFDCHSRDTYKRFPLPKRDHHEL